MTLRSYLGRMASSLLVVTLAACGGGGGDSPPATYTIGGAVAGLAAGTQIVVNDNGNDPLTLSANSAYTFTKPVDANGSYMVTITTQPAGQSCSAANFSGAGVTANVANVNITCSSAGHTVAGTVAGLAAGQNVVLKNNGADATTVSVNGAFAFAAPVALNGSYSVTVGTQPTGQTCTVANGTGAGVVANITNVAVTCSTNTYTIGGTVAGLTAGHQVTLNNNSANPTIVAANGAFTFSTPVTSNGTYAVTVGTQPIGQTCTVANGTGAGVTANVANVTVTCSTNTYTISGTVAGLGAGKQVTLNNNSANPTTVSVNGAFTFSTPVTFNGTYAVTVGTQPAGQTCTVANGTGAGVTASVANVTVTCSTNTYTIGGTVAGLTAGKQVTLNNNSANPTTVAANGTFTFSTAVASGSPYAVTVGTQPVGQTCTVANGTGSNVTANVTNVTVTCSTNTYTIGGTVSGLTAGKQVTLNNNSANPTTVAANGTFTFSTPVAFGGAYAVAVGTQPVGQTCTVANGSGTNVAANVTNVAVTCTTNTYTISGTVSGLVATQGVTLANNGANSTVVNANGNFSFSVPVGYGTNYAVTVGTQPTGETCRITGGSGANVTANVSSVVVTCRLALAYVVNSTDATVSQYSVGLDGGLTSIGAAVSTGGTNSNVIAVDPTGRYAYVTNHGSGDITQFSINATTGALTSLGLVSSGGPTPYSVAVDPTGQYVYVTNQDDPTGGASSVAQFKIGATGTLTPIGSGAVTLLNGGATSVVAYQISISGIHAYVANRNTDTGNGTIAQFDINPNTGALTWSGPDVSTGAGSGSLGIAINPVATFAYVDNFDVNTVSQFSINASTGRLTAIPANTLPTDVHPYPITISADGQFAYWANKANNSLSQSKIDPSTGSLGSGTNTTVTGGHPQYVAIDPFSRYVYVVNFELAVDPGNTVSQYNIDLATGLLTPIAGPAVPTGAGPFSIVITR